MEKEGKIPKNGRLVSTYEMLYKDGDGEGHIETLRKFDFPPERADEARFLSQAAPVKIRRSRAKQHSRSEKMFLDFGDAHVGYRRMGDNDYVPTHNPEAMDIALQIARDKQPDLIVVGGDMLDSPQLSKFDMDSNQFATTLQMSIDALYKYLARLRSDAPDAHIVYTKGNHDLRNEKTLIRHAMPLFGIKPANMPESFAVNSIPFLLRFNELDIDMVEQYKINDRLVTEHGEYSVNNGSTVHKYLARRALSTMFHHSHRQEYGRRTFPNGVSLEAFSSGCLADTTGSVPANGNKIDDRGRVVERFMNWDNGALLGYYNEGDKPFHIQPVKMEHPDYEAMVDGKLYVPRPDVVYSLRTGN